MSSSPYSLKLRLLQNVVILTKAVVTSCSQASLLLSLLANWFPLLTHSDVTIFQDEAAY